MRFYFLTRSTIGVEIAFDSAFTSRHRGRLSSARVDRMSRTLITNGYVVTVDPRRNVFPGGFVAIDGARISAVGPASQSPKRDTLRRGDRRARRNRAARPHQHAPAPLVHAVQGAGRRLPAGRLGRRIPAAALAQPDARRRCACRATLAGMEMLATGTTCSLNHSVTTTTPDLVTASIEPQRELGIRQVYAKELRCRTPGNPRHPLSLDEALAAFERGGPPLGRRARRAASASAWSSNPTPIGSPPA